MARQTTGGTFATHFMRTVRDLESAETLDGSRPVVADTSAAGEHRTTEEEGGGIIHKTVIEAHVARILSCKLS